MTVSAKTKYILVALCLMGASLLAGCSEAPKKVEATQTPGSAAPGGGPQRQTLSASGATAGSGTAPLRSLRGK